MTEYSLDFTDANELEKKATIWYESTNVTLTEEGLALKAQENASADVRIQVVEPIGVGLSWRPAQSVNIAAEINPPGKFVVDGGSVKYPNGELYARYSADALHWSNWQYIKIDKPKDINEPEQRYSGTIRIPYSQRQQYSELLLQYQKMDVPWVSDEEATVEWIVQNDPNFFEKPAPFIGYVQFLFEISLKGGQTIKNINFDIGWAVGGMHIAPRDEEGKKRLNLDVPWRYKAPSLREKSQ